MINTQFQSVKHAINFAKPAALIQFALLVFQIVIRLLFFQILKYRNISSLM